MRDLAGVVTRRLVTGAVSRVVGHEVEVRGLRLAVADGVVVDARDGEVPGEVVAVAGDGAKVLVYGEPAGLRRGDRVRPLSGRPSVTVGAGLLGRVLGPDGRPIDGGPAIDGVPTPIDAPAPSPLERARIDRALPVGVRVIDGLNTVGRGQRMGVFAGSGVGKSTLLSMMVRGTAADLSVIALIGERGREVREFIEDDLGPEGLARSIVVVATSDQPPLVRLRAGFVATRIAEWFADHGHDVLLTMDSLTRLAMAQRDVGLAAGEPPTARGYTPSVFTLLPRLLERAGPRTTGSITGFYTVLVDGDDMNDPIADAARSILDGHLVLDRRLATAGRYPPIDPLASLSRCAAAVNSPERTAMGAVLRRGLAALDEIRDLLDVGAYVPGANAVADRALALRGQIDAFLLQATDELTPEDELWEGLGRLAAALTVEVGA